MKTTLMLAAAASLFVGPIAVAEKDDHDHDDHAHEGEGQPKEAH